MARPMANDPPFATLNHFEGDSRTGESDFLRIGIIHKIGAPSIAQIEKLIGELHEARNLLESERERIERETARYIKFTQIASASVKIVSDTLSEWHQAGHPLSEFVTRSVADDSTGRMGGPSLGSAPDRN